MKKLYLAGLVGASILLFYCQKSAPLAYQPPVVTVTSFSSMLSGRATVHPGTSLSFYLWSQVSGPRRAMIDHPSQAATSVSGLVPGTYVFELFATDNKGATGSAYDTLQVTAL
ncbi:PKD domain-containing protein [Dinghuibacter silviterrae]|uniref:PKD domain-containing protein n=1 Tax=Dinghuibacter silviterrae TaxID=1539049 RepID=A0A4R8DXY3_9BACT|nr:hypothetical protein [Dinghuibacter silviterrae]TDX02307.1 hypothetical protein EDB95_3362 [Dinghuibacter silviterrae]